MSEGHAMQALPGQGPVFFSPAVKDSGHSRILAAP